MWIHGRLGSGWDMRRTIVFVRDGRLPVFLWLRLSERLTTKATRLGKTRLRGLERKCRDDAIAFYY